MSAYRLFTSTSAVWCTLMLALSLGWINPAQASESQEYEAQLRQLQDNIQRLQKELESVQGARDELRRSEEHTSELQSRGHLVCRLLLEKKKKTLNARRSVTLDVELYRAP